MNKRIKIWRDNFAECPWENWDCMIPLMTKGSTNFDGNDHSNGGIIEAIKEKATKGRILRHLLKIANILEIDLNWYDERSYNVDEKVSELLSEITTTNFDQISELLDLFKISNIKYTSKGHSQGDVIDVLIVQTQDWKTETGRKFSKKVEQEEFEYAKKLYDAWIWGDVYGFTIEEKKAFTKTYEDGTTEESEEWEEIDSCGGFYEDDWKTNGILDNVPKELHEQVLNYSYEDIEY